MLGISGGGGLGGRFGGVPHFDSELGKGECGPLGWVVPLRLVLAL